MLKRRLLWQGLLGVAVLAVAVFVCPAVTQASFDSSNLISDGAFVDTNRMNVAAIQRFLESKNSYLKDFSEGGRSAAQIIYDASHGFNEASGSINGITINSATGTVSPQVILVTLQKEQSLISRTTRDDNALSKAMGYACPDSGGCNPRYAGFTKQVENAAWQFRYNYERAQGHGFVDYQVGQSFCFDDWNGTHCGRFGNRSTASLYRYTPHVYNGNYNFWNLFFNVYNFTVQEFSAQLVAKTGAATLHSGQVTTVWVRYKNTGSATWYPRQVNLGLVDSGHRPDNDGYPLAYHWFHYIRPATVGGPIAPGQYGTFAFTIRNHDLQGGNYPLNVGLVSSDGTWFGSDTHATWNITIRPRYSAQVVAQTGPVTLHSGQVSTMWIRYKNIGSTTWYPRQVNLGLVYENNSPNNSGSPLAYRWFYYIRPATVPGPIAPGQYGTFAFTVRNPNLPGGNYRLDAGLVTADGNWFGPNTHVSWDVTVKPHYSAQLVAQSASSPSLHSGEVTTLWVRYRNNSSKTWYPGQVNLGLVNPDYSPNNLGSWLTYRWFYYIRPATVAGPIAPGQYGTFAFTVRNPNLPDGNYRLDAGLVTADGNWFDATTHVGWDIVASN